MSKTYKVEKAENKPSLIAGIVRPMHDFQTNMRMGDMDDEDEDGLNEGEDNELNLDLGLGTPSSFNQTPSYVRLTPSG